MSIGGGSRDGLPDGGWDDAAFRASTDAALAAYLDTQAGVLAPLGADAERLLAEARTAVAGGKKFRAAFCHWGFRAVQPALSAADETALARACASLELLPTTTSSTPPTRGGAGRRPTGRWSPNTGPTAGAATRNSTAPPERSCSATCSWPGPTSCCGAAASAGTGSGPRSRSSTCAAPR
jgi:hypothetical protein